MSVSSVLKKVISPAIVNLDTHAGIATANIILSYIFTLGKNRTKLPEEIIEPVKRFTLTPTQGQVEMSEPATYFTQSRTKVGLND